MGRYGNRLLMAAAGGGGVVKTPTFVQGQRTYLYASAVTAGNFLIAMNLAYPSTGYATACHDSVNGSSNPWTQLGTKETSSAGGTLTLWYYPNTLAGTPTLTFTYSGSPTSFGYGVAEYANVAAADQVAGNQGDSASLSAGPTGTLAEAGELVIGIGYEGSSSSTTLTAGSGFTMRYPTAAATYPTFLMDQVVSSTAAVSASLTSTVSNQWVMYVATFKPA